MAEAQRLAREYELVYILRPTVAPSDARKVAERITDVVQKRGAKLVRVDNWGKRKLAYPIKKASRGFFVYLKLVGFSDVVAELERNLRNLDEVIRYQTVRLDEVHDIETLEVDPEEVVFRDIETAAEEEEEEPSFEERLGMTSRRRPEAEEEEGMEGEETGEGDEEAAPDDETGDVGTDEEDED